MVALLMVMIAVGLLACDGEPAKEASAGVEATAEVKKEVSVEALAVRARAPVASPSPCRAVPSSRATSPMASG